MQATTSDLIWQQEASDRWVARHGDVWLIIEVWGLGLDFILSMGEDRLAMQRMGSTTTLEGAKALAQQYVNKAAGG